MKRPLIIILNQDRSPSLPDLSHLWQVLEFLSFRVQVFSNVRQVISILDDVSPDLIILDGPLPEKISSSLRNIGVNFDDARPPCLVLKEDTFSGDFPSDILAIHDRIVNKLVGQCRKHLRLPVQLPCVYFHKGTSFFGEIHSLGTGGAFVKTAWQQLREGEPLELGIPLIGMKKEIEVKSRILYLINPRQENNYLQGIGVKFIPQDPKVFQLLRDFLKYSLLNETIPGFSRLTSNSLETSMLDGFENPSTVVSPRQSLKL
jgi:Tfp pilus assembly protein PilZ